MTGSVASITSSLTDPFIGIVITVFVLIDILNQSHANHHFVLCIWRRSLQGSTYIGISASKNVLAWWPHLNTMEFNRCLHLCTCPYTCCTAGLVLKYSVDGSCGPLSTGQTPGSAAYEAHMSLASYLAHKQLNIDMWDGESLLQVRTVRGRGGTCYQRQRSSNSFSLAEQSMRSSSQLSFSKYTHHTPPCGV